MVYDRSLMPYYLDHISLESCCDLIYRAELKINFPYCRVTLPLVFQISPLMASYSLSPPLGCALIRQFWEEPNQVGRIPCGIRATAMAPLFFSTLVPP